MEKYKNKDKESKGVGKYGIEANMCADTSINTDPNGSWTGVVTDNPNEMPVQDVDDLQLSKKGDFSPFFII